MREPVYLLLDLSTKTHEAYPISNELYEKYLGGKILATKLLYDLTPVGIDVFAPESMVIINTGPMNDTGAPSSSRFNMTFKNALTGGIASSNSGGTFGIMLKRAGFDGLIIKGKAEKPTTIRIVDGDLLLEDAMDLWGKDAEKTQEQLPKAYGKLVIGPAGENLVRYACAVSGERVAGRCGAGAVLGAKNIKAIIAYGTKRPRLEDPENFTKSVRKWVKFLKSHPMTGESLPRYGSAGMLNNANASQVLPTHNFKHGQYKDAEKICGEELADKHLVRNSGCVSCPIRCERAGHGSRKRGKGGQSLKLWACSGQILRIVICR